MAQVELIMPKMGESIMEATILKWVKNVGDAVEVDETILEIATDKVDSEVPSPVKGVIKEILFKEDDVVPIGTAIAMIATEGEDVQPESTPSVAEAPSASSNGKADSNGHAPAQEKKAPATATATAEIPKSTSNKFYSPLVRKIAQEEGISLNELENLDGTGMHGRVTKHDILGYVENRGSGATTTAPAQKSTMPAPDAPVSKPATSVSGAVEIVEMDRMRKLIADHMVNSKRTSPHVTSFVEVDVTNMVNWRNKVKGEFQKKYGEKITFTPLFMEAVAKALTDYPMVNVSVDGTNILVKKNLNLGMATALPSGNLIVPVIKNAEQLNLVGLTKQVNDLANRARQNKLKPEEIQDGTFTLTNVGTFGNVMGTPIINQPQVAIMATGAIKKKPAVLETEHGDVIAIRHMMYLSLSYDHRVVDGALGGSFLRRVGDYMEQFDSNRTV
ncbi:MAG: dihydrolipoamide acetyltransferase family protein [Saprospiraceae bacterium]